MPEPVTVSPETKSPKHSRPVKPPVEKWQSYMGLISTTMGVLGLVGSAGVWVAASFYMGDVEIQPDKPVDLLIVKVFDSKGQQSMYYTPKFQLFPGDYHMEIELPNAEKLQYNTTVKFHETSHIPLVVPADAAHQTRLKTERKWWQFWRR